MKLTPIAVWRMRAWPWPGSPTCTSSTCRTSGPPVLWNLTALVIAMLSWLWIRLFLGLLRLGGVGRRGAGHGLLHQRSGPQHCTGSGTGGARGGIAATALHRLQGRALQLKPLDGEAHHVQVHREPGL